MYRLYFFFRSEGVIRYAHECLEFIRVRFRSFAEARPVVAGYFTVSFVFCLMAVNAGLPLWLPVAMCLFVYAGASQFAALALISSGASQLGRASGRERVCKYV